MATCPFMNFNKSPNVVAPSHCRDDCAINIYGQCAFSIIAIDLIKNLRKSNPSEKE